MQPPFELRLRISADAMLSLQVQEGYQDPFVGHLQLCGAAGFGFSWGQRDLAGLLAFADALRPMLKPVPPDDLKYRPSAGGAS